MIRAYLTAAAFALAAPAIAATPRELLVTAAFDAPAKPAALASVGQAIAASEAQLAANGGDHEAQITRATGIGYRAKLTRSAGDAKRSRQLFEAMIAANPRDAEAQFLLGGWHLDSVAEGFLTASVLGAKKEPGLAAIDRAIALGGDRAMFKGFGALMRARLDPADPQALALADQAAGAPTPSPLDQIARRDGTALAMALRGGDRKAIAALVKRLLPFGRIS